MDALRAGWGAVRRWASVATSPAVWLDRLLLVAWLAAAVALAWNAARISGTALVGSAAGLVLLLAALAQFGVVKVVGPILFYEIVRAGRQRRTFLIRVAYTAGLLLLLLYFWLTRRTDWSTAGALSANQLAEMAAVFFIVFCLTQYVAVCLLTPATIATAITDEKERKTLEFLLATDLHNRELVFGKFAARVGRLLLLFIAGVPVLGLMQFFGGIDPELLLVTFAITGLTLLSLAAVGLLVSVALPRSREAVVVAYAVPLAFLLLTWFLDVFLLSPAAVAFSTSLPQWSITAVHVVVAGNPTRLLYTLLSNEPYKVDELVEMFGGFARFHATVVAGCVLLSVLSVRAIALSQGTGGAVRARRARRRARIRADAMFWKEVHVEGRLRLGWFLRALAVVAVLASFGTAGAMWWLHLARGTSDSSLAEEANVWLRTVTVVVGLLGHVAVATRAAGGVSGEHEKDTLIGLLTSPLATAEIFHAKAVGSLCAARPLVVWMGALWLVGLLLGGVEPAGVVFLLVAWVPPALFVTAAGLLCSTTAPNGFRAMLLTLFVMLMAFLGHWLVTACCVFAPLAFGTGGGGGDVLGHLAMVEVGLSPPIVMGLAPFRTFNDLDFSNNGFMAGSVLFGGVAWVAAAVLVYAAAQEQFDHKYHRQPFPRTTVPEATP